MTPPRKHDVTLRDWYEVHFERHSAVRDDWEADHAVRVERADAMAVAQTARSYAGDFRNVPGCGALVGVRIDESDEGGMDAYAIVLETP